MANLRNSLLITVFLLLAFDPDRSLISADCGATLSNCGSTYARARAGDISSCNPYHNYNNCTFNAVSVGPCSLQEINDNTGVRVIRIAEARCSSAIPKTSLALVVAAAVISFFMKA